MPEFGQNFRTQILVGLKAEGVGEGEKLRQELMRLEVEMLRLQAEFGTGARDLREYMAAYPDLARQISFAATRLKAFEDQISQPSDALERKGLAQAGAVDKATAAVQKASDAINAAFDKEAAAVEAATQREIHARQRFEAELDRLMQDHLAMLARVQAAEQAAIDSLQKQKDEALQREANRRRNADATFNEGTFRREATAQIEALEAIGRQTITTGDRFHALRNEWLDLVNAGKGDSPRGNAILDQLDHLRQSLATTGYQVQTVTGAFEDTNRVINAGAAYTRKSWTEFEWLGKHIEGVGWAFNSTAKAGEQGGEAARRASYGWLNFAHAVQDAQYGVGAVLNNIPLVVQGLGGGPGLAGTVMIAAVAFETFRGFVGDVRTELGMIVDPMQAFARSSADLKAKLAALEAKKWKVDVDYRDIEMATKALHEHEEARKAFEAGTKTKAQAALAEEAQKVVEAAGGTQKISEVILGAATAQGMTFAKPSDIEEEKRLGDVVAQIEKTKAGALPGVRFLMEKQAQAVEAQRKEIEERIEAANVQYATDLAGQFKLGNEDAIKMVKGLAEREPQAFRPDARRRLKELPETAEEKEFKDMAEESDKWINEQVEEGKKKAKADLKAAQDAREGIVGQHAAVFGAKKAMGAKLEGDILKLIAGGEEDPEKLKAAIMADVTRRVAESKTVPEEKIPDVAVKVAERPVKKVLDELSSNAAIGDSLAATARKAIAEGEAKAKAKEEKPEISHEAARIGREAAEGIHNSILEWAAQNTPVEQIRKGMMGWMTRNVKEAGVEPELAPDVAAKLFEEQLGKVRAELLVRGGVNAQTARAELGERRVKAIGQEQGRERRVERVGDVARRPAIAQEIMFRSGGMATPEQAEHGAERYQSLINQGVAPPVAANRVMEELARMIQQQRAIMDQTNAMMNGMAGMLNQANQHLGMIGANQGMMRGQMNNMRWQKPAPWNTVPAG